MAGSSRLEQEGFLLPEEHRDRTDAGSSSAPGRSLTVGIGMSVCCVLMVVGRGGSLTWFAGAGFTVLLVAFAFVASRGIERQAREIEELSGRRGS